MIWAGLALVVLMALLGAPLFAVVLAAAMLGFLAVGVDLAAVAINVYDLTTSSFWRRCRSSPSRAT